MASLNAHYSARDIETRILAALRPAGLNPEERLSPGDLAALDHFRTGELPSCSSWRRSAVRIASSTSAPGSRVRRA